MAAPLDILIVTATTTEALAVKRVFEEVTGKAAAPFTCGGPVYQDLGIVSTARVAMALCEMGAGGLGGSQETVRQGIEELQPTAVMMVGIAFGVNSRKQNIGDILISDRLMVYDLQRLGAEINIPRGDRPHASPALISRFRNAALTWEQDNGRPRLGLVLSGDKLVDNLDYRDQLKKLEPEAVGGEMEGAGLYVACQTAGVQWILVKAICDWADGKKGRNSQKRQELAADNAAKFVLHAIQHAPFSRGTSRTRSNTNNSTTSHHAEIPEKSRSNLPHQPYFFGRMAELEVIATAISTEARTWGALIDGPGGIGKTALALEAGHRAPSADFNHKIFLTSKVRELSPAGEVKREDFTFPSFIALLTELGRELGEDNIGQTDPESRPNTVRRALVGSRALVVFDNVETLPEVERVRLFQFLSYLPAGCKAIITSRQRTDIDARTIRLDRLERQDALALTAELAKKNRYLQGLNQQELESLYENTNGNPLLITWVVGQLGRPGSYRRTVSEACAFLASAPSGNDPLDYIFGDLLDAFTDSEIAVLTALSHFNQPVGVVWIAKVAQLPEQVTLTALQDLADRALVVSGEEDRRYLLPALTATFLRQRRPQLISMTGNQLAVQVHLLSIEMDHGSYDYSNNSDDDWPAISAAIPMLVLGDNDRLQITCAALGKFFDMSNRWDEYLDFVISSENRAIHCGDFYRAGWRAFDAGRMHHIQGATSEVLNCANRCASHWESDRRAGPREQALAVRLRGIGQKMGGNYPAATESYRQSLNLLMSVESESINVANSLNDLAVVEQLQGLYSEAEKDYSEALRIANANDYTDLTAYCTGNLGDLALDCEQWEKGERLARKALKLSEALGRDYLIGSNCQRLGRAMARQGRPAEGLPYALRAVEIFERIGFQSRLPEAEATLKDCGG